MLFSQYAAVHLKSGDVLQPHIGQKNGFSAATGSEREPKPLNPLRATHPLRDTDEAEGYGWVSGGVLLNKGVGRAAVSGSRPGSFRVSELILQAP